MQPIVASLFRYRKQATLVLLLALFIFAAWFGYQQYRAYTIKQASIAFAEFVSKEEGDTTLANQLINSGTPYAPLAALLQAKVFFSQDKFAESKQLLLFVQKHAQDELVIDTATAYLAQVEWQLDDIDAALSLLNTLPNYLSYYKAFTKGDIYASQQNTEQAAQFYRQAIDFAKEYNISAERAELRLRSL